MPNLSQFYGIIIKMYFRGAEHAPPHVHAKYGGWKAEFDIRTGALLQGSFPPKATKLVGEWLKIHRKELLDIWENQQFKKIEPLE